MQYFVLQRATATGALDFETPAIDISGMPLLVFELIGYVVNGTSQSILAQLQTSNDLEIWSNVSGSDASLSADGSDFGVALASNPGYGKYVRFKLTLAGITEASYSLVLNTYASS